MVGTNKILTVSYGTFSCTLEGFDDPFSTMRSIAEYFRDLAADDRYFGAEPPTPDAEMLHRIAEREVQRRVEAQVQDDGILLRQVEADNAAAVDEFDSSADASELNAIDAAEADEEPAEAPAPEVPAESSESVAEKLSRIRAVVARTREAEATLVDHDGSDLPDDHAEDAETLSDDSADEVPADATEEEIAEAFSAFDDAEAQETGEASEEDGAPDEEHGGEEHHLAEVLDEASGDADDATWSPEPEFEETDLEVEDDLGEDEAQTAEMSEEPSAEAEDAQDEADEPSGDETRAAEDVAEDGALEDGVQSDDEADEADVVTLHGDDHQDEAQVEDEVAEDPLSLETPWTEFEDDSERDDAQSQGDRAEAAESAFEDASDADEAAGDDEDHVLSGDTAEDHAEEHDADEDNDLAEGIRQAIGEMNEDDDDGADAPWEHGDESDLDESARASQLEENLEAGQLAARDRLGVDRDETEESSDVERLLEQTDSQLADTEASRRRSAIAHLKAAVAATKADRLLKRVTARERSESEEQAQYRDDLAQVVRPRRPAEAGEHQSERPAPLDENKAPLMLISELRVDEETGAETADSFMPVRPRRVSADADESGEGAGSFAEFAKEMGATELPDLLEAAAAYAAFVENRPHFSRPQLMKRVAKYDRSADFSREDGLRSFGQLLRQGKIQKLKRGQFTVAETTRFNPDSRIAGE